MLKLNWLYIYIFQPITEFQYGIGLMQRRSCIESIPFPKYFFNFREQVIQSVDMCKYQCQSYILTVAEPRGGEAEPSRLLSAHFHQEIVKIVCVPRCVTIFFEMPCYYMQTKMCFKRGNQVGTMRL